MAKKKPLTYKQLKNKYWPQVRKYILIRDNYTCQLCNKKAKVFDIDHCFSRSSQAIHFDDRNLTTLCKACHLAKSYRQGDAEYRVYELVRYREGDVSFDELRHLSKKPQKVTEKDVLTLLDEYKARWPINILGARL